MSDLEIIILVGPPGSGKSTLCKEYPGHIRVNQDEQGRKGCMQVFNEALKSKRSIIVDRMNFNKEQRSRFLDKARKEGYLTTIYNLQCPLQTCIDRCITRFKSKEGHKTVKTEKDARNAVNFFFNNYEEVSEDEADFIKTFNKG